MSCTASTKMITQEELYKVIDRGDAKVRGYPLFEKNVSIIQSMELHSLYKNKTVHYSIRTRESKISGVNNE